MTRPKRHLCVIGDSDTISKYVLSPTLQSSCHTTASSFFVIGSPENVGVGFRVLAGCNCVTRNCRDTRSPVRHTKPPHATHWTLPLHNNSTDAHHRGSPFLKAWMQHLEDHADLRYPNLADVYVDQENSV
jgi:hypothetical protein